MKKTLLLITGPSCSGKSTILDQLLKDEANYCGIVSTTTRKPRAGEIEGQHYYFIDHETSVEMEQNKEFAELNVYNNIRYGVTNKEFFEKMESGKTACIVVDPNGVRQYQSFVWSLDEDIYVISVFVKVDEDLRISRLVDRTQRDILSCSLDRVREIEDILHTNFKRLKAIITQERGWETELIYNLTVNGRSLTQAVADIDSYMESLLK